MVKRHVASAGKVAHCALDDGKVGRRLLLVRASRDHRYRESADRQGGDRPLLLMDAPHPRILQNTTDELVHAVGAIPHQGLLLAALIIEYTLIVLGQPGGKRDASRILGAGGWRSVLEHHSDRSE